MLKLPKLAFRKNQEKRIAAKTHEREEKRADASFAILQEQATKSDQRRYNEERHEHIERQTWAQQVAISSAQLKAARRLSCFTGTAAIFAFLSAIGIVWSVLVAKDANVEANRAWINPLTPRIRPDIDKPFIIGGPIHIDLDFNNVGREPALNLKISVFSDYLPTPADLKLAKVPSVVGDVCKEFPPQDPIGAAFPPRAENRSSVFYSATASTTGGVKKLVYTQDFFDQKEILRVEGCVSYVTFGTEHHTSFCSLFTSRSTEAVGGCGAATQKVD